MTSYTERLAQKIAGQTGGSKPGAADESLLKGRDNVKPTSGVAKTGPGQMLAYSNMALKVQQELEGVKNKLREYEGSVIVKPLDPKLIVPSRWANRHESSFVSEAFVALKDEIAVAGGNIQPIKVRRLKPVEGEGAEGAPQYEVIFGHRRHRACLELNLEVLSIIVEDISDADLFAEMDRENRTRADLSPMEQGEMYLRALEEGLFSSQAKLAEHVGTDKATVSRYVRLAKLPAEVIAAFGSASLIPYRWAPVLEEALEKNRDGVLSRAKSIIEDNEGNTVEDWLDSQLVLSQLVNEPAEKPESQVKVTELSIEGKSLGVLKLQPNGSMKINIKPGLTGSQIKLILKQIEESFKAN